MEVVPLTAPPVSQSLHRLEFFDSAPHLCGTVATFLAEGLRAGDACLVIARPEHASGIEPRLRALGLEPLKLSVSGRFAILDAQHTLDRFMNGSFPDPQLFEQEIGAALDALRPETCGGVRAYGEMVDVLWGGGNASGALRLEQLWNDLLHRRPMHLLCAYGTGHFSTTDDDAGVRAICGLHDGDGAAEILRRLSDHRPAPSGQPSPRPAELAHQLRGALWPLQSALEILRDAAATPGQRRFALDVVERQARQLAKTIDAL